MKHLILSYQQANQVPILGEGRHKTLQEKQIRETKKQQKMSSLSCFTPSQTSIFLPQAKPSSPRIPTPKPRNPFSVSCFRPPELAIPPAVETFWSWLSDNRVVSAKCPVKPGLVPEGLGLVAQKDIAKNEVVLEVPKRFWINPDTVAASEIGSVCSGLKPWVSVALFLIREKQKKEDSLWSSYIDILPQFTNSTIFWSEEELSELQGSQLLSTTLGVKELVQNEFLKAEEQVLVPNKRLFPSPITLDDFFWAFGMLRSRAFTRLSGQSLVLIPLADLMNHSPSITSQDYAWEIKGAGLFSRELLFSLRSPIPVKAGGQVLIQYDLNKSNAELALDYGFVESTSGRNAYTLTLEIPESDPFYGDKLDIAESNGLGEAAYFDITLGQPIPEKMLPYLRLLALGGADAFLLEGLFRNNVWDHLELPVSRANEELVYQVVRDACKAALSGYHTTVEEDEKLEKEDLDPRLEISVGIRLGEKRVLQQIDEIFKEKETEVDILEYYQERRLRLLGLTCDEGEIIFWE